LQLLNAILTNTIHVLLYHLSPPTPAASQCDRLWYTCTI